MFLGGWVEVRADHLIFVISIAKGGTKNEVFASFFVPQLAIVLLLT